MPKYYDAATRAQVIALRAHGASAKEVTAITEVSDRTQRKIIARAKERGWQEGGPIKDEHVEDGEKSGAPCKQTESLDELVASTVRKDQDGGEKSLNQMDFEFKEMGINVGHSTIAKILKEQEFVKVKPTRKPGLTPCMREDRLKFCERHKD